MTYHSEYGQDSYLDNEIFKGLRGGVFVEAGAIDGFVDSNSLFFERERGWRGLLIEPNPSMAYKLVRNRPLARHSVAALWDKDTTVPFNAIVDHVFIGWSAIPETMSGDHALNIQRRVPERNKITLDVPARPLADVMWDAGLSSANYVSLDLEGAEPRVLSVFPFDQIKVEVWGIEGHNQSKTIVELMTQKGYHHLARIGPDEFWSRNPHHGKIR